MLILPLDVIVSTFAMFLSYIICNVVYHNIAYTKPNLLVLLLLNAMLNSLFFFLLKTHAGIIRYSSYYEIWRILLSISATNVLLLILVFVFKYHQPVSFTALVLNFTLSLLLLILTRYLIVQIYGRLIMNKGEKNERAVVFGVSDSSVALARSILMGNNRRLKLVGFISTDVNFKQTRIMDLPVYLFDKNRTIRSDIEDARIDAKVGAGLRSIIIAFGINTIIFDNNNYLEELSEDFLRICTLMNVKVLLGQSPLDVTDGNVPKNIMRNIQIEDLLGREEIEINIERISLQLHDKVILVTGAAGSIGSEIVRQLAKFKPKIVILYDAAETPLHYIQLELEDRFPDLMFVPVIGDVRNSKRLTVLFETYHPEIVYHAAAYKHVPLMERNPCEAVLVNVLGTRNVVNHALRYGAERFVMISTDKAVNPTNIMGASKRVAELYVQSLAKYVERKDSKYKFITTRFGNVLGSNGSVIPRFRQQIEQGGPVTVTHREITRYFMTIPEACQLVLEAGSIGKNGEIYVFDMGQPIKIDDLARRMIQLAGFVPDKDIKIEYTGLRPGEKLYEELLSDMEYTKPTYHKKILVALVREYEFKEVTKAINQLVSCSKLGNTDETVRFMKALIPEFVSKNSIFEKFDI